MTDYRTLARECANSCGRPKSSQEEIEIIAAAIQKAMENVPPLILVKNGHDVGFRIAIGPNINDVIEMPYLLSDWQKIAAYYGLSLTIEEEAPKKGKTP